MINVITDFNTRVKEIDLYFTFLDQIINENAQLFFPSKKRNNKTSLDPELQKVLKAQGFLILYNLIESSIKKSIEQIYEKLNSENIFYKDVRDEIKVIWIEINYKNFTQRGARDIFNIIERIADDTIAMQFDGKKVISGNIDAKKIREFATTYGFSSKTHWLAKSGNGLLFVKTNRNDLAHGVISFAECGKKHTLEDLAKTKKEVIIFLKGILNNVDQYISSKKYLKSSSTQAA